MPCFIALTAVLCFCSLGIIHWGVGTAEGNLSTDEVLTSRAGTGSGISQGCAVYRFAVLDAEVVHGSLLGGSTLTHELAADAGEAFSGNSVVATIGGGVGLFCRLRAGNECEGADGNRTNKCEGTLEIEVHRGSLSGVLYTSSEQPRNTILGWFPTLGLLTRKEPKGRK